MNNTKPGYPFEMNYEALADSLIESINTRRTALGITDDEHGKLIVLTTNRQFDEWIIADSENSARIMLGSKCPLFRHNIVDALPYDADAQVVDFDGVKVGFVVDRLDDEAWHRKEL